MRSRGLDTTQGDAIQPGDAPEGLEFATFAAGCFWGVEDFLRHLNGVKDAISGYSGGNVDHPTYEQVCSGRTGHAEAVLVTFDPKVISYEDLLEQFWRHHDPTTPNRQGPDVGTQYRSAIFFYSPEQKQIAENSAKRFQDRFRRPIVTDIVPASTFWPAEEYHQRYTERTGFGGCHVANW
ncbi:MAG TPA: peptide-methionine (S)-S-oxide reductase MsrA [Acidimicrobiales bacterium]|nr:peptide-methionine (S)-S-oxide reductase MsrA [Acidimicrobiales bacterium]